MKINQFQEFELDEEAYLEGKEASETNAGDHINCSNPYPKYTPQRESWLLGWNADLSCIEETK